MSIPSAALNPVGINGSLIDLFEKAPKLQTSVCEEISDWDPVARQLAKQDAFRARFNRDKINELKNRVHHSTFGFLKAYTGMTGSTVSSFVRALYNADRKYIELCQQLCNEAGDPNFFRSLSAQLPVLPVQPIAVAPLPKPAAPNLIRVAENYISKDEVTIVAQQLLEKQEALRKENAAFQQRIAALAAAGNVKKVEVQEIPECSICLDQKVNVSIKCGHLFCALCVETIKNCAICRVPVEDKRPFQS